MQDAVVLANSLYEMKSVTPEDIDDALSSFKEGRYAQVKEQFDASKMSAKLIYGQVRYLVFSFPFVFRYATLYPVISPATLALTSSPFVTFNVIFE